MILYQFLYRYDGYSFAKIGDKKKHVIPLRIISFICWILIALNFIAYKELISGLFSIPIQIQAVVRVAVGLRIK